MATVSMGGSIGDVSIGVEVDASNVASDVEKAAKTPMQKAGDSLADALGVGLRNGFAKSATAAAAALVSPLTTKIQGDLGKAGGSLADALGVGLRNGFAKTAAAAAAALAAPLTAKIQSALGPQLSGVVAQFGQTLGTAQGRADALATAGQSIGSAFASALPGAASALGRFRDGFTSAAVAASSFSGLAGKIGGTTRVALDTASSAVRGFGSAASIVFDVTLGTAQRRADALATAGRSIGSAFASTLPGAASALGRLRDGFTNSAVAASSFSGLAGKIGGTARVALDAASSAARSFGSAASSVFAATSGAASKAWGTISSGASSAWSAISSGVAATSSAWSAISSGASKAWSALSSGAAAAGQAIGDALGAASRVAGAALTATLGTALVKGFGRLEAIDTATAKLTGLGQSADSIASIMSSATAAVKGTAFGLGEAASAAAQFSAAGVPLDGIQRSLTVLASAASVAGADLGEMTTIFGKVAATGKLNGEVVQQLAERGIPVLSLLSKQLGVTAEDVSKMVGSGQIDFETFQTAMEANLGPAAQAMGESFSGMLKNVGAALGRFGAAAQQPAFDALKVLFPALISLLDQFTAAVAPVAEIIGNVLGPAAERLAGFLSGINFQVTAGGASSFLAALGPLLPVIGGLLGLMGPLLTSLPLIGPLFAGVGGPAGVAVGALLALTVIKPETLLAGFESLASSLPGAITTIATAASTLLPALLERVAANASIFIVGIVQLITAVIPAISAAIPQIISAIATLIPSLVTTLLGMIPTLLSAALLLFQAIVTGVVTALPLIITALVTLLPQLISSLMGMLPSIIAATLQLLLGIVFGVQTALPLIISALLELLPLLLTSLVGMIPALVDGALQLFLGLVNGYSESLPVMLSALNELLPLLISSLVGMIPALIDGALQLFLGIVSGLATAIPFIITALNELLPQVISSLTGMLPTLIGGALQLFLGIALGLARATPQIIGAVIGLLPVIIGALLGMVPLLISAGVDLIGGLVQGLGEAAGSVGDTLLKIAQDAVDDFLSFLGIKSPSRLFASFGVNTMEGYVKGMNAMSGQVDKAMTDIIPPDVNGNVAVNGTSLALGAGYSGSAPSTTTNNNRVEAPITITGPDPYKAALEAADRIAQEGSR